MLSGVVPGCLALVPLLVVGLHDVIWEEINIKAHLRSAVTAHPQ